VNSDDSLIIFTRNAVHGTVKTRLAATIGDDRALQVYQWLIGHTFSVTKRIDVKKAVFYSEFVATADVWDDSYFKTVQQGADLGQRMSNAFKAILKNNRTKAVIIGTDCYDLTEAIIARAFEQLNNYDVVIGPAFDGGYYLLGMKAHHPTLFENINWSTSAVLNETLARCNESALTYCLLPVLDDIDDEKDLLNTAIFDKP
jgi:rSAM/selenodomain-associated transferase 1